MVKKTIAAIFSVLVLSTVLTACNTTRGVGEDLGRTVVVRSLALQPELSSNHQRYGMASYR